MGKKHLFRIPTSIGTKIGFDSFCGIHWWWNTVGQSHNSAEYPYGEPENDGKVCQVCLKSARSKTSRIVYTQRPLELFDGYPKLVIFKRIPTKIDSEVHRSRCKFVALKLQEDLDDVCRMFQTPDDSPISSRLGISIGNLVIVSETRRFTEAPVDFGVSRDARQWAYNMLMYSATGFEMHPAYRVAWMQLTNPKEADPGDAMVGLMEAGDDGPILEYFKEWAKMVK